MSASGRLASVPVAGAGGSAWVRFTSHAIERYASRVRPSLTHGQATAEVLAVAGVGRIVGSCPPRIRGRGLLWLELADVAFPLVVDGNDRSVLVATTCLVPACLGTTPRRRELRNVPAPRRRAPEPYRRERWQRLVEPWDAEMAA